MYLRFVELKVGHEYIAKVKQMYEEKVIPTLQRVQGCLHASLIHADHHADECVSMTLWARSEDAEAYERSGVFQQLVDEGKQFQMGSSEWKISLSEDFTLAYEPVDEEPSVTAYELPVTSGSALVSKGSLGSIHVQIVAPQIRQGKLDEFKRIYRTEILPELRKVKGCRYVDLMDGLKGTNEVISFTIWDSKQDSDTYERTGLFQELTAKVEHTFAEMHQWKMQLAKETHSRIVTSEEMVVEGYSVVTGKSFL